MDERRAIHPSQSLRDGERTNLFGGNCGFGFWSEKTGEILMRLITPEITIDKDDPFKNDCLDRKPFAERLMGLITNIEDNLVLSLDGQWGDGKTTFVKMWEVLLEKNDIKSIYFDAFKNDYFDDPFVALVGNVTALLEKVIPKKEKIAELKAKASKVGVQLLSLGARVGIKAATLGHFGDAEIEQFKDIVSGTSNFASKIIEDKINTYKEDVDAIEEFRTKLEELAEEAFSQNQKPLVFIVDELDRCKPTYALNLMEKIKHLFSVKHIVFVLVMHTRQLEEAVKCLYGQNIDARTYLHKFINIECKLPKKNDDPIENDYRKYCETLHKAHELNSLAYSQDFVALLARLMELSLRDLQRCYTNLVLFYSTTPSNKFDGGGLADFLAVLKVKKVDVYEALKRKTISIEELWSKQLGFDRLSLTPEDSGMINTLKSFLKICLLPDDEFEKLGEKTDERVIWNKWRLHYHHRLRDRTELLPYLCSQLESFNFPRDSNR